MNDATVYTANQIKHQPGEFAHLLALVGEETRRKALALLSPEERKRLLDETQLDIAVTSPNDNYEK